MNHHSFAAIVLACCLATSASAQPGAPGLPDLSVPLAPQAEALGAHDLRWIRTANDFDQDPLSAEAIDAEIERRLRHYDGETPVVALEVPINTKRLSPPRGPLRYTEFDGRLTNLTDSATVAAFSREAYFWTYAEHVIAVPGDTHRDQLNVYAVARALEVLRVRYPRAYQRLFQDVRRFPAETPGTTYNNRFSTVLFSFDTRGAFAMGGTAYEFPCPASAAGVYRCSNLAVVSLNPVSIAGGSAGAGSAPIYRRSADESYMRYLREGLVETLVHEMLHRYVDHRATHEPAYAELRNIRQHPDSVLNFQLEEAFVTATSLGYFLDEGGLQGFVPFFYRGTLDLNLQAVQRVSTAELDRVIALFRPQPTSSLYTDLLRLPILDPPAAP